jgi:hypothetical protein
MTKLMIGTTPMSSENLLTTKQLFWTDMKYLLKTCCQKLGHNVTSLELILVLEDFESIHTNGFLSFDQDTLAMELASIDMDDLVWSSEIVEQSLLLVSMALEPICKSFRIGQPVSFWQDREISRRVFCSSQTLLGQACDYLSIDVLSSVVDLFINPIMSKTIANKYFFDTNNNQYKGLYFREVAKLTELLKADLPEVNQWDGVLCCFLLGRLDLLTLFPVFTNVVQLSTPSLERLTPISRSLNEWSNFSWLTYRKSDGGMRMVGEFVREVLLFTHSCVLLSAMDRLHVLMQSVCLSDVIIPFSNEIQTRIESELLSACSWNGKLFLQLFAFYCSCDLSRFNAIWNTIANDGISKSGIESAQTENARSAIIGFVEALPTSIVPHRQELYWSFQLQILGPVKFIKTVSSAVDASFGQNVRPVLSLSTNALQENLLSVLTNQVDGRHLYLLTQLSDFESSRDEYWKSLMMLVLYLPKTHKAGLSHIPLEQLKVPEQAFGDAELATEVTATFAKLVITSIIYKETAMHSVELLNRFTVFEQFKKRIFLCLAEGKNKLAMLSLCLSHHMFDSIESLFLDKNGCVTYAQSIDIIPQLTPLLKYHHFVSAAQPSSRMSTPTPSSDNVLNELFKPNSLLSVLFRVCYQATMSSNKQMVISISALHAKLFSLFGNNINPIVDSLLKSFLEPFGTDNSALFNFVGQYCTCSQAM